MAKKLTKQLKMIVPGGKAVPGQQLGPVLVPLVSILVNSVKRLMLKLRIE